MGERPSRSHCADLGVTAGIAEMLVQSHGVADGVPVIELLPALPSRWPSGRVRGLRARGGLTVEELTWADGVVTGAVLRATATAAVEVRWNGRRRRLMIAAGHTHTLP